jgi:hypothetical protein
VKKNNKEFHKEHYKKYKKLYLGLSLNRRQECRKLVDESKIGKPCKRCGVYYPPYILDYHHRDPSEKVSSLSRMCSLGQIERIKAEIEKCDLVCSNCHREIEFGGK